MKASEIENKARQNTLALGLSSSDPDEEAELSIFMRTANQAYGDGYRSALYDIRAWLLNSVRENNFATVSLEQIEKACGIEEGK